MCLEAINKSMDVYYTFLVTVTFLRQISHISFDEGIRVRLTKDAAPIYIVDITIQMYVEHGNQLSLQSNLLPTDTDAYLR